MTDAPATITSADYAALFSLASEIGREPNLDRLLLKILEKSRPWIHSEACSIFLPDPATGELLIHSAQGSSAPRLAELRVPAGQGIVGSAMLEKRTIRVDDVSQDSRFYAAADKKTGWTTRALIAAPLLDGDHCIGAIEFLNPIGRSAFTDHDELMIEYFSSLVAASLVRIQSHEAALERAQVQRDLDLAREMQEGILPTAFPDPAVYQGLDLYATLDPATEVSGDLYDFFPGPDGCLYFLVGDVSGKGVAAGLFMAVTRTLIRATARMGLNPVQVLEAVNEQLVPENPAFLFVTIILGLYEPTTGEIVYAQGGHNRAVYIRRNGEADFQPSGGQPLGVFSDATFAPLTCTLEPGEVFVLYSDGVTEAMNASHQLYSDERLTSLLVGVQDLGSKSITDRIIDDVESFVAGAEQSDDITVMVLRRLP
jgi:sigma-B regulation protein RsbU (phosphoserine phosphatase)